MDIQVSLKVRAAIKAKLVELGLHVDEELPDYVMVLVANRRTKVQMDQDLQLFLGDNTSKFTGWLQHVLSKLDELTSAGPSGGTTAVTGASKKKTVTEKPKSASPKKKKPVEEKAGRRKEISTEKIKEKEKSKPTSSSRSSSKAEDKQKGKSSKSDVGSIRHRESDRKSKDEESRPRTSSTSSSRDRSGSGSAEKRKIQEHTTSPTKAKRQKESKTTESSTLKFQLKKSDSKKLPHKSALMAHDESPPKRSLPLLGNKSPEREPDKELPVDVSDSTHAEGERDFKIPPVPLKKKAESTGAGAEDDEFLSLNAAEDDDFLKEDKEKEELELLRKKALESKNKSRNFMRSLQVNERIIQKQKEIEEKEKVKVEAMERSHTEKAKSSPQGSPEKIHLSDPNEVSSSENKEAVSSSSPTKPSESRQSIGSRIRSILLSNKGDMNVKDKRGDAREILERRKRQRDGNHGNETTRSRESRDRSPSPENKKLRSTVGALIKREKHVEDEEYDPTQPEVKVAVASVVHVTARPKREKDAPKSLVMRAFADAQKSIVISNSRQFDHRRRSRSRSRSRSRERPVNRRARDEDDEYERRARGRRHEGELDRRRPRESSRGRGSIADRVGRRLRREDIHGEDENVEVKKRSIKDRLGGLGNGYKPAVRKPIHERLGVKTRSHDHVMSEKGRDQTIEIDDPESKLAAYGDIQDEDMIVVSVPSSTAGRNVSLESMKERPRISIPLRDDDDTTDDEQYDPVETSLELRRKSLAQASNRSDGGKSSSDNDYIVEEYEQEETDDEIEVVIRDTSLKLPEPFDEEDQNADTDVNATSDVRQSRHEQKQHLQLQSEAELGQIMVKGPEIRTAVQANAAVSTSEVGSASAVKTTKVFQGAWQAAAYRPAPLAGLQISNALNTQVAGQCKYWPDCGFKDKCIFIHPRCKFGDNCKNTNCAYKHNGNIKVVPGGLQTSAFSGRTPSLEREQCKYFPACHTLNCPFYHPTPCKFGLGCNNDMCKNYHPGETRAQKLKATLNGRKYLPAAHLLKWSKTTTPTTSTSSA